MTKPETALLDPARYPFRSVIEPRFGDLDYNLHINNVAMLSIVEEGRLRFHANAGHLAGEYGLRPLVASMRVEYLAEGLHPDPLTVCTALTGIGRTSYTLDQLVLQRDRPITYVRTVMVCTDGTGPAPIPAPFRNAAQPWMLHA